jgi:FAD/FMN-containing dehydrogenase
VDGTAVRADAESHPDLFWALRGGGGSFGVVTAMELALYRTPDIYAGVLFWPFERAAEVLHAWREWLPSVPEEVTSIGRLLQFPPIPDLPEFLRGRSFAVVEAVVLGPDAVGEEVLRPLRDLGPGMDTFALIPPSGLAALHMDPPDPVPYAGDGGLLSDLPAAAVDALVAAAGPGSGSPLLTVEVRHLGGALGRAERGNGALACIEEPFAQFAAGFTPSPEAARAVDEGLTRLGEALAPWQSGRSYMNFAERPVSGERLFGEEVLGRLREVRATYDPGGLFVSNHPVAPA